MDIRSAQPTDRHAWLRMRSALWPNSDADLGADIDAYFVNAANALEQVYLAISDVGYAAGFLELRLRNYAEGSAQPLVPYIEGWYVDPAYRGRGVGARLVEAAAQWALRSGFSEIASDAELDNEVSHRAHRSMGFVETERLVCFLKQLK